LGNKVFLDNKKSPVCLRRAFFSEPEMKLTIPSSSRTQFIDITAEVRKAVEKTGIKDGACMIYVPHTTAGVTINESADPSVASDILSVLDRLVPQQGEYRHAEGNSPAHVKASLMGSSQLVAIEDNRLVLGTWQGIFFCEFDGPRTRNVYLSFLTSCPS
jgi:secondary thiamine-phosphate synthase enzyme